MTPAELTRLAAARGLSMLAITDHDAIDGLDEARRMAPSGLEILSGAELTVHVADREAHILAYGIDVTHPGLHAALGDLARKREARAREIVARLVELGVEIEFGDVQAASGAGTIARPHVARALVERGHARSLDDAFRRWLGRHAPAFVPKEALTPREAFDMIKEAGGVGSLAHPGTFRRDDLIPVLVESGLEAPAGLVAMSPVTDLDPERTLDQPGRPSCALFSQSTWRGFLRLVDMVENALVSDLLKPASSLVDADLHPTPAADRAHPRAQA